MSRTRSPVVLVVLFLLVLWGLAGGASAGVLDASWTAPTTKTDGSPLTGLQMYRVYYASETSTPCPGSAFFTVSASRFGDATVTVTLTGLTENTVYYVSVTAVDTSGNASSCSMVASAPARPSPPDATVPADAVPDAVNAQVVPDQVVLDTDSFADTNGQALAAYSANWPVFANWNQLAVQGSPGFGAGIGGGQGNRRTGQTWTDNQWAEIVVDQVSPWNMIFFVGVRGTDADGGGRGYGGGWHPSTPYQIIRWSPWAELGTVIAEDPGGHQGQSGDVVNVQVVGSVITLKVTRGGAVLLTLSVTDTWYPTDGTPWLLVCCADAESLRYGGSWRAGSVAP